MAKITASLVKELREMTGAGMMDCKKALTACDGDFEASKELLRKQGQLLANKRADRETKEGAIYACLKDGKAVMIKVGSETDFVSRNEQFLEFAENLSEKALKTGVDNFMEQDGVQNLFNEIISKMGENIAFLGGELWEIPEGHIVNGYIHTNKKIGTLVEISSSEAADVDKIKAVCKDIAMHITASEVKALSEEDLAPEVLEKERKFLTEQAKESGKPDNIIPKMIEGRLKKFTKEVCLLEQNFVKDPEKTIRQYLKNAGKELGANLTVTRFYKESF